MSIKTLLTVGKFAIAAVTVIPPAVEGAAIIVKGTKNFIGSKIEKSETIQEMKKIYKLRTEEGIITVDYEEV